MTPAPKNKYALRTRFARDIVCEFLPPAPRRSKGRSAARPAKTVILCGGMPGYPGGRMELMNFLSQKGFWVFVPRYRGTWESGGSFLARSPERDVIDVIDGLSRGNGFKDAYFGKTYRIARPPKSEVYVIGSSFGGAAAILASRDPRVRCAIALSPVTDWRVETKAEPIARLAEFTRDAFGDAYRGAASTSRTPWKKLCSGTFFNPMHEAASIDGMKLLIIHAKDDEIVYARTSATFARAVGTKLSLMPRGGHLGLSSIASPAIWRIIQKFFARSSAVSRFINKNV
jgi:alpha-beta hydrolase superfamily lysophospholipase